MIDVFEFAKTNALYRSNKKLSRLLFEERRLHRFREFAVFVQQNSPYYQQIMADRQIDPARCKPEDFPPLTKKELIRNFNEIVTVRGLTYEEVAAFLRTRSSPETLMRGRYVVIHTSGTSGEVAFFPYDRKAWAHAVAALARAKGFNFLTSRRKKIAFMGATQGHFAGVTSASAVRQWPLSMFYELRTFEINRPLREAISEMNAYRPDILVGYGTGLKALAEKQLEGKLKIRPEVVTNSGEPILVADKRVIESAFGKCIRNFYTCSEHMFMALKEPWQESMWLFEDELVFEIFPDYTLVTNIFNRTLPMIRYHMTDILTPLDCTDHAPYRSIAEVAGRVESQAKFKNQHGSTDAISPATIGEILVPHVRQFQMRLTGFESFEFALVLVTGITEAQKEEALSAARSTLTGILEEKEMGNVKFEICVTPEIPLDEKTGKFRLIVNSAYSR